MNKVIVSEGSFISRKKFLKEIKKSLGDYELFTFDKDDHYNYVSQIVTEISCFGQNRLFIIKELPKVEAKTDAQARTKVLGYFKKLFPSIPNGNILLFNNIGISAESFLKEVRKYGEVHKTPQKMVKSDARRLVNNYFKKININLSEDVTSLIVDSLNLSGNDVDKDKLYLIIKKFHTYIHGKTKITKEDVYDVCSFSKEFIIWNLYNFFDNKKGCSSVKLITNYLDEAKYFRHEASMLIKSMIWRYGLLLMAKNGINDKIPIEEIKSNILNINKLESSGKAQKIKLKLKKKKDKPIPEYSSKMIDSIMSRNYGVVALTCYTLDRLMLIYHTLNKTLIKIRSGCTDAEIKIAIMVNILVICEKISKKNTVDGVLEHKKEIYGGMYGRNI